MIYFSANEGEKLPSISFCNNIYRVISVSHFKNITNDVGLLRINKQKKCSHHHRRNK